MAKKYCTVANHNCHNFQNGQCKTDTCKYAVDLYSILTPQFREMTITYLGKILENQQEILKRLEKQK